MLQEEMFQRNLSSISDTKILCCEGVKQVKFSFFSLLSHDWSQ